MKHRILNAFIGAGGAAAAIVMGFAVTPLMELHRIELVETRLDRDEAHIASLEAALDGRAAKPSSVTIPMPGPGNSIYMDWPAESPPKPTKKDSNLVVPRGAATNAWEIDPETPCLGSHVGHRWCISSTMPGGGLWMQPFSLPYSEIPAPTKKDPNTGCWYSPQDMSYTVRLERCGSDPRFPSGGELVVGDGPCMAAPGGGRWCYSATKPGVMVFYDRHRHTRGCPVDCAQSPFEANHP